MVFCKHGLSRWSLGFSGGSDSKECLQCRRPGFNPWVGKIPWRRPWQPTLVFLPGKSPRTERPSGLQSMGLQSVGHDWVTSLSLLWCVCVCVCSVIQLCLTLCDPMHHSQPISSVCGIFQARILEWVAISFSRGSFQPRDQSLVYPALASGFFTTVPL